MGAGMSDLIKILFIGAVLVGGAFVLVANSMTSVEQIPPESVNLRFRQATQGLADPTPMRARDGSGQILTLRHRDQGLVPSPPSDLIILSWQGPKVGFVETRVPIWLIGIRGPMRDYLFRKSQFNPSDWALTVNEIQDAGRGVVVDDFARDGRRTLVLAE
jgi:hypothetical protein